MIINSQLTISLPLRDSAGFHLSQEMAPVFPHAQGACAAGWLRLRLYLSYAIGAGEHITVRLGCQILPAQQTQLDGQARSKTLQQGVVARLGLPGLDDLIQHKKDGDRGHIAVLTQYPAGVLELLVG